MQFSSLATYAELVTILDVVASDGWSLRCDLIARLKAKGCCLRCRHAGKCACPPSPVKPKQVVVQQPPSPPKPAAAAAAAAAPAFVETDFKAGDGIDEDDIEALRAATARPAAAAASLSSSTPVRSQFVTGQFQKPPAAAAAAAAAAASSPLKRTASNASSSSDQPPPLERVDYATKRQRTASPEPPKEVKLVVAQKHALDVYLEGKRTLSLYGQAGTGKSTLFHVMKVESKPRSITVAFTSSTGLSAENINGQTFHRFFGVDIHNKERGVYIAMAKYKKNQFMIATQPRRDEYDRKCAEIQEDRTLTHAQRIERIKELDSNPQDRWYYTDGVDLVSRILRCDRIVIDEVYGLPLSILRTGLLVLETVCERIRPVPKLVFAGDPMQRACIPRTVTPKSYAWQHELAKEDRIFIASKESPVWKAMNPEEVVLTVIHRQDDPMEQRLLSAIRMSYLTPKLRAMLKGMERDMMAMQKMIAEEQAANPDSYIPPVYMNFNRAPVAQWNRAELSKLKTPLYVARPQVFVLYNDKSCGRFYASCVYDGTTARVHKVPAHAPCDKATQMVYTLSDEELRVIDDAMYDGKRSISTIIKQAIKKAGADLDAKFNTSGQFKVGAPIRSLMNQKRPSKEPQVANGTRGRVIDVPGDFYPVPVPPTVPHADHYRSLLMTAFDPNDQDLTGFYPITMLREKDGLMSKIGCVDQFISLFPDDDAVEWFNRKLQLCVRGHPCSLNWADTPDSAVGAEYERGVIDMGSAAQRMCRGGLFYVMISRFKKLKRTHIVNYNEGAIFSEAPQWFYCQPKDGILGQLGVQDVASYVRFDKDAGRIYLGNELMPDAVLDKLYANCASADA